MIFYASPTIAKWCIFRKPQNEVRNSQLTNLYIAHFLNPKNLATLQYLHCPLYLLALIKKKIKFSSNIRKFRVKQLKIHIWLTASLNMGKFFASPHILGSSSSYFTLNFLIYEGNFLSFFISAWLLMQIRLKVFQLPNCSVYHPLIKSPFSLLKYSQELVYI